MRLSAGLGDGLPGLIVDRFGPLVVAVDYAGADGLTAPVLLDLLRDACPGHHVVAKARASTDGTNRFETASHAPEGGTLPLIAH